MFFFALLVMYSLPHSPLRTYFYIVCLGHIEIVQSYQNDNFQVIQLIMYQGHKRATV